MRAPTWCMRSPIRSAHLASAARRGQRHPAGALYAGGPPPRGGEICSGLGSDPRRGSHAQRGREIPCAGRVAGGAGETTAAADNLAALGVPQESIPALSAAAQNVKRLMNNAPCSVSREEIAAIYQTLFPEHA